MKKIILVLVTAFVLGCGTPEEKKIASIGKDKITQGEFDLEVARLKKVMVPEDYVMTDDEKLQFEAHILNNMIMKKVFIKEMDRLDIKVDQATIDTQYNQLITQYDSEVKMIEEIESKGFTIEELKRDFNYQLRLSELTSYASEQDITIPDEELKKYYDENRETIFMIPGKVISARHILIKIEDINPNIALEKIKAIRAEIVAGKDFSEAAKEYSQGPSGADGGQLGEFQQGQMVKEFEMVAFAIPLNQISEPVLTQFGYHLILIDDRIDANYAPFEETKEYINNKLKVEQFFSKIEQDAKIKKPDWAETN